MKKDKIKNYFKTNRNKKIKKFKNVKNKYKIKKLKSKILKWKNLKMLKIKINCKLTQNKKEWN